MGCVCFPPNHFFPGTFPFPESVAEDARDGVEYREWLGLGLNKNVLASEGPWQAPNLGKVLVGGNLSRKTTGKCSSSQCE